MTESQPLSPIEDLVDVLTLKDIGLAHISVTDVQGRDASESIGTPSARVFEGRSQKMPHGRVFGGQVLAQCVMAAGITVQDAVEDGPARPIHSLHGYFMRPGDDRLPIRFAVEEMRDGGSFSTRRVHAVQKGAPIMSMVCSFQEHADGLDHQLEMPDVPGPEGLPSLADLFLEVDDPQAQHLARERPIDQRHVEGDIFTSPGPDRVATNNVWMHANGELPDDPLLQAAVLAYSSDYSLLEAVLRRHGIAWVDPRLRVASLDHSMWFHRPATLNEWLLYSESSPSATSGRGLSIGQMFQNGQLVATTAQEGMVRVKER